MSDKQNIRYVVISPMKNEENYVTRTLDAVVAQTVAPMEWVIVNDGSTDRSPKIVADYATRYPWIRRLDVEGLGQRLPEHYGGHVVDLFYDGLRSVRTDAELIVKLDCDVSFDRNFFATILEAFSRDGRLGITSGVSFVLKDGQLVEEEAPSEHTLGATKVYRRKCFEDIGGLVASMGWDGIDEIKARMLGWTARPIRDLVVHHHRPEGQASGLLASGVERGNGSYFMGYHPVFMIARAAGRFLRPGLAADGAGMLIGYFGSLVRNKPRIPDVDFIRFLRKSQIRRLLLLKNEI